MPELKCTLPDLPKELNPDGLEVEYSPIGEKREGEWSFLFDGHSWENVYWENRKDDPSTFTARLIPRKPEPSYVDVPIVDGLFTIPEKNWSHRIANYCIGKQFTDTTYALAGYVYADGEKSDYPIQFGCENSADTFWGAYMDDDTHYRRATHVRLVDLSKLTEVK